MLADQLVERFASNRLMKREYEHVKLHVTVMNTLFRKDLSGISAPNPRLKNRESFNASNILQVLQFIHIMTVYTAFTIVSK